MITAHQFPSFKTLFPRVSEMSFPLVFQPAVSRLPPHHHTLPQPKGCCTSPQRCWPGDDETSIRKRPAERSRLNWSNVLKTGLARGCFSKLHRTKFSHIIQNFNVWYALKHCTSGTVRGGRNVQTSTGNSKKKPRWPATILWTKSCDWDVQHPANNGISDLYPYILELYPPPSNSGK